MQMKTQLSPKPGKSFDKDRVKIYLNTLPVGKYECVVTDMKEVDSDRSGTGFILNFDIINGPSHVGVQVEPWMKFPENASARGNLSAKQARTQDEEECQKTAAAVFGFTEAEAHKLDQASYDKAINKIGKDRPDGSSPMAGRKVVIEVVGYKNKTTGKEGKYARVLPHPETRALVSGTKAEEAPKPIKAPPAPPALAKSKGPAQSFEQWYLSQGFIVHPDDDDFAFNEATGEVISFEDLKVRSISF